MQNIILNNNSRPACPTKILMTFLSVSDNLLEDVYIILQRNVDNFEKKNIRCAVLVIRCTVPALEACS